MTTPWISYERYSSDLQNPRSCDQQHADNMTAEGGAPAARRFTEPETSGTDDPDRRSAFSELLRALKAEPYKYRLRIWDIDRFGRFSSPETFFYWSEVVRRAGALEIVFTKTPTTGNGLADFFIRGTGAHGAGAFSRSRSQLVTRGFGDQARRGYWCGGPPPFGFDLEYEGRAGRPSERVHFVWTGDGWRKDAINPETGAPTRSVPAGEKFTALAKPANARLVLGDPRAITTVREIFALYLEGRGLRRIAVYLNDQDRPGPRGGEWTVQTVRSILMNPVYAGRRSWGRQCLSKLYARQGSGELRERPDHEVRQKLQRLDGSGPKKKIKESVPQSGWVDAAATGPALVSPEIFEQAQAGRKVRRELEGPLGRGRGETSPHMLSGMIRCPRCGRKYVACSYGPRVLADGTKNPKRSAYCCGVYMRNGKKACARGPLDKIRLESGVVKWLTVTLALDLVHGELRSKIRGELEAIFKPAKVEAAAAETRKRLDAVNEEIDGFKKLKPSVAALYEERIEAALAEREKLKAELSRAPAPASPTPDLDGLTEKALGHLDRLKAVLDKGPAPEHRRFIAAFVSHIEPAAKPGQATLYYYDPPGQALVSNLSAAACRSST